MQCHYLQFFLALNGKVMASIGKVVEDYLEIHVEFTCGRDKRQRQRE